LNEDYYKKFLIFLPAEAKYFLSEAKQITSNLPFFQKIILPESMLSMARANPRSKKLAFL